MKWTRVGGGDGCRGQAICAERVTSQVQRFQMAASFETLFLAFRTPFSTKPKFQPDKSGRHNESTSHLKEILDT